MMKVATAAEMKQIDRLAQTDFFIPGAVLMERAALSLRRIIEERFNLSGQKAYIFCGKGNNGGDGLALARLLFESAVEVVVVLAYEPSQFSGLASQNLSSAAKFGLTIVNWREVNVKQLQQAGLIVDALLGTGAVGTPGEPLASIITMINDAKRPVVAVDIP
jgi:NAD(P)H-hydrate epimerase